MMATIVALTLSVALNLIGAVLIFRLSGQTATMLDRAHERTTTYTEGLVERLMAMDFQTYKAYEMLQNSPEPEAVPEPTLPHTPVGPDKGGFGSSLGLTALSNRQYVGEASAVRASEELLADFPVEVSR